MNLDLNNIVEQLEKNEFLNKFMKELEEAIKNFSQNKEGVKMESIRLTPKQEFEFERREFRFLQEYFKKELSDLSNGELFKVTNKYDGDTELNRYKVAQYKDNLECKYIALGKDLPGNIQIGDFVRKIDGKYVLDEEATRYVKESMEKLKKEVRGYK